MKQRNGILAALWAVRMAAALALITGGDAAAQRPDMPVCGELEKASVDELLDYLGKDRKTLSDNCIEFAIRRAGVDGPSLVPAAGGMRAVEILIPYLDFRGKMFDAYRGHFTFNITLYAYPASAAISTFGIQGADEDRERAIARLIAVIADTSSSDLVTENAVEAVRRICGYMDTVRHIANSELKAVVELGEAAKASTNAFSASRLREQARKLAEKCTPSETRSRCEAALD